MTLALFGVPAAVMRPTTLGLDIIVASFASVRFARADLFRWRTLWPFLVGALPMVFLGTIKLPRGGLPPARRVMLLIARRACSSTLR